LVIIKGRKGGMFDANDWRKDFRVKKGKENDTGAVG
jgi:hypothetical protein